jgi:4-hydroxy-2-oxoheptanedioate aldolase
MFAHSVPGVLGAEYDNNANDSLLVIVQIESRQGVESVENIAAVDGIDVLFIGECAQVQHCAG